MQLQIQAPPPSQIWKFSSANTNQNFHNQHWSVQPPQRRKRFHGTLEPFSSIDKNFHKITRLKHKTNFIRIFSKSYYEMIRNAVTYLAPCVTHVWHVWHVTYVTCMTCDICDISNNMCDSCRCEVFPVSKGCFTYKVFYNFRKCTLKRSEVLLQLLGFGFEGEWCDWNCSEQYKLLSEWWVNV